MKTATTKNNQHSHHSDSTLLCADCGNSQHNSVRSRGRRNWNRNTEIDMDRACSHGLTPEVRHVAGNTTQSNVRGNIIQTVLNEVRNGEGMTIAIIRVGAAEL